MLSKVVPIFKGYLCMDSAIIESAVSLSHKVLSLMMKVLPVDLWRRGTKLNSLMVGQEQEAGSYCALGSCPQMLAYWTPPCSSSVASSLRH